MKVGIVGVGNVGATVAYTLAISTEIPELVLVDKNSDKAKGEALDIRHGIPFIPYVNIDYGDISSLSGLDLIIICAGSPRTVEGSRLDLAKKNTELFRKLIPMISEVNSKAIYLVVTNPVDILTYATIKFSGCPPKRVIGSGNVLDTIRFKSILGQYFNVEPGDVNAYILGEHGDSSFPVWSHASIGCSPINGLAGYDKREMDKVYERVKSVSKEIIKLKGSTYYAISLCVLKIVQAIHLNKNKVLPVSTLIDDYSGVSDVCLSVPTVVNSSGVERILDIPLTGSEQKMLKKSASIIASVLDDIGLRK